MMLPVPDGAGPGVNPHARGCAGLSGPVMLLYAPWLGGSPRGSRYAGYRQVEPGPREGLPGFTAQETLSSAQ